MTYPPKISSLNGLVDLARMDGVDIKPTLLRVLTDLYVHKQTHSSEEERHFVELMRRLLDVVDVPARATVAKTLATYSAAPLLLIQRLARDVIAVAEPILRHSPHLTTSELRAIVDELGLSHAAVIAARFVQPEIADEAGTTAAHAGEPQPHANAIPPAAASELSELFFAANAAERRLILLNIGYAPVALPRLPAQVSETIHRLERAALQHHVDEVIRELERSLGLAPDQARRIVGDPSGEAIVVAAKTLDMPSAVLQRILLFVSPIVSQSIERIYELIRLYEEIERDAALRLLSIWQDADEQQPAARQPPRSRDETVRAREAAPRPVSMPGSEQRMPSETPATSRPRQ